MNNDRGAGVKELTLNFNMLPFIGQCKLESAENVQEGTISFYSNCGQLRVPNWEQQLGLIDESFWFTHLLKSYRLKEAVCFNQPTEDETCEYHVVACYNEALTKSCYEKNCIRFDISISIVDRLSLDSPQVAGYHWCNYVLRNELIFSESYAKYLGYESGKDMATTSEQFMALLHPDDVSTMLKLFEYAFTGNEKATQTSEIRLRRKDGSFAWIASKLTSTIWNKEGQVVKVSGVVVDIDAIKRMELQTKNDKEQLEKMIDNAPFAIYKYRGQGYNVYVNQALCQMTGLSREQIEGYGWKQLFQSASVDFLADKQDILINDRLSQVVTADGTTKYLRFLSSAKSLPDDRVALGMAIDVTEEYLSRKNLEKKRLELELELKEAERTTKSKSQFLATVSHEIRTPLNGIIGMSSLLKSSNLDIEQQDMVETITKSGHHLLELINDVLDLSKIEAGLLEIHLQPTNVRDLILGTVNMVKPIAIQKNLSLNVNISESIPPQLMLDTTKMRQSLTNLMSNAVKFTEKGQVDLNCELLERVGDQIKVRFSVHDTGIGIDEVGMTRLFKAFSQVDSSISRKYGGTGLGLHISKQLVELMDSKLLVESKINCGTRFWFDVKLQETNVVIKSSSNSQELHANGDDKLDKLSILLVEDNLINQKVAAKLLEKIGVKCDIANDGFKCLDAISKKSYNLILMDLSMPGMSGIDATKEIRQRSVGTRPWIIALTANALDKDREECMNAGMDDFLAKPFNLSGLKSVLSKAATNMPVS